MLTHQKYIPIATSKAGLCLTPKNWEEVHVSMMAYYLDSLVFKPGLDRLKKLTHWPQYMGWSGPTVINASSLSANKEGIYTLVSSYDGSKLRLNSQELCDIILHLAPQMVILPSNIIKDFPTLWSHWNPSIIPYISMQDWHANPNQPQAHGVYLKLGAHDATLLEQFSTQKSLPRYAMGSIDMAQLHHLNKQGVEWIELANPAQDALNGQVYTHEGLLNLTDEKTKMVFDPIDKSCHCPTCSSHLTQAYLHHLYSNTPLLCQRFLLQHNAYFIRSLLD